MVSFRRVVAHGLINDEGSFDAVIWVNGREDGKDFEHVIRLEGVYVSSNDAYSYAYNAIERLGIVDIG